MRRKKGQEQETPVRGDGRITPQDVQQVEFRLAFRGYNERDVDAFLDRVTEDLASYLEEAERSRGFAPGATDPVSSSTTEATEILERAREEAARIVRQAEEEAEAIRAAAGPPGGDARAAVAPFLSREREFLQSLGSLVQSHAEEIRQMIMAVRARTESQGPEEHPSSPPSPDGDREPSATLAGADDPIVLPDEDGSSETGAGGSGAPAVADGSSEPAVTAENRPAEPRERSLRELFWGEE